MTGIAAAVAHLKSLTAEPSRSDSAGADAATLRHRAETLLNAALADQGYTARLTVDGGVTLTAADGRAISLTMDAFIARFLPALEAVASGEDAEQLAAFMAAYQDLAGPADAPKLWLADGYAPGQRGNGKEWDIIEEAPKRPIDIGDQDTVLSADPGKMSGGHFNTSYDPGFIGPAIGHLPGLGDEDYISRPIDAPPLSGGGHCGDDEQKAVPVLVQNQNISFTEDISGGFNGSIFLNGLPPGGVINNITFTAWPPGARVTFKPDGTYTLVPPPDYSGEVRLTYSFMDGTGATRTATITSFIAPVSDPALSAPSSNGVEDTPAAIGALLADPALGIRESDRDGSEIITGVTIGRPPAGFTLTPPAATPGAIISIAANGSITITSSLPGDAGEAAIRAALATVTLVPPADFSGAASFDVSIVTRDGDAAPRTTTLPHVVTFAPVTDPVAIPAQSSSGFEDQPLNFGQNVAWVETEVPGDRSEIVTRVVINAPPAGYVITPGTATGAVVTLEPDGRYTITSTLTGQAGEDAIRAALNGFSIMPPLHGDAEVSIGFSVSVRDQTGSVRTTNGSHDLIFAARADAPVIAGSGSGEEDTPIAVPVTAGLTDADGTETITRAEIEGVPAGASLAFTPHPDGTVSGTGLAGDPLIITGTPAAITAILASLQLTPPLDFHGVIPLTVRATSTETNPTGGQVDVLNAVTTSIVNVTVAAEADVPAITAGTTTGLQDQWIRFGNDSEIVFGVTDTNAINGGETINRITLLPADPAFTIRFSPLLTPPAGVSMTFDSGTGVYTITSTLADPVAAEAAIRAFMAGLETRGGAFLADDTTIAITVTALDRDGSTRTNTATHAIIVDPVGDPPTVDVTGSAGDEDTPIAVGTNITYAVIDPSENIISLEVTGIPSGATPNLTPVAGIVVTPITGGFRIESDGVTILTPAQLETAIRTTLNSFTLQPPTDSEDDIPLTIVATSRDTDGSIGTSTPTTHQVTVNPVSDAAIGPASISGFEDAPIAIGTALANATTGLRQTDDNGPEAITQITIGGFPPGATVLVTPTGSGSVSFDAGTGIYTITGPDEAAIRATLATMTVQTATHADAEFSLSVAVTTRDSAAAPLVTPLSIPVTVAARADAPGITGGVTVLEDAGAFNPNIAVTRTDADGSETITLVVIDQVTGGGVVTFPGLDTTKVSLSVAGSGPTAVYTLTLLPGATQADMDAALATTRVTAPADSDADITIRVSGRSTETNPTGGQIDVLHATTTATITIPVNPVSDAVTISGGTTGNEDTTFTFGTGVTWTEGEVPADRSEVVTEVTVALPPGAAVAGWVITPPGSPADVTITGSNATGFTITSTLTGQAGENAIRAALDAFQITPPLHADNEISLAIGVTTQDGTAAPVTANGSHAITIAARADVPTGSGSGSGDEDSVIAVPITIGLTDSDGSETITSVSITGIPAGSIVSWAGNTSGSVAGLGTVGSPLVITGTPAEIAARVAALHIRPPTDSDADFSLSVTVNNAETNPTGGQVNILSNSTTFAVPVTVNPVSDAVTVSGSSTFNEDTTHAFGKDIGWTEGEIVSDRSEVVSRVTIGGAPAGWTIAAPSSPADVTITGDSATGFTIVSTLTGQAGENAIRAALNGFTATPPVHSSANATIAVTIYAKDGTAAEIASAVYNHPLIVRAVADAPDAGAPDPVTLPFTGVEDNRIQISGPGAANGGITVSPSADNADTSEVFTYTITGVPAGYSFHTAASGGSAVGSLSGGIWTFTKAQIDAGLFLQPPTQTSATLNLTINARSDESGPGAGAEIATPTATDSAPFRVVFGAVTDPVLINASSSIVSENNGSTTDAQQTLINLGADLNLSLADSTDGSQDIEIVLSGLPAGFTVPQTAPGTITMIVDNVAGTITLRDTGSSAPADVLAFLDTLQVRLPASMNDSDQNFTVGVATSTQELSTGVTVTQSGSHAVTIRAVADTPTTDADAGTPGVQATRTINAVEDGGGIAVNIGAALNDTDGSETLSVVVSGLAVAQGSLNYATGGGVTVSRDGVTGAYTLSGDATAINAMLAATVLTKPTDNSTDVTLTITSTATESNPTEPDAPAGSEIATPTATSTATVTILIAPRAEAPTLAVGSIANQNEWATSADDIPLSGVFTVTQADGDDDETEGLFVEITALPAGTTLRDSLGNLISTTGSGLDGPIWRLPIGSLGNAFIRLGEDFSGAVTLKATGIARDTDPEGGAHELATSQQTISFTVASVADAPTVGGSSSVIDEDSLAADADNLIGTEITYTKNDTDGSEAITAVEVTGFTATAGATLGFTIMGAALSGVTAGVGGATITPSGDGFIITGPEADIRATLDTLRVSPQTNSDINAALSVTVTSTDGASSTSATGSHAIRVRAEADMPSAIVTTAPAPVAEDGADIMLTINPNRSADTDGSELMTVRITIPQDGGSPIGTLATGTFGNVTVTMTSAGVYLITSSSTTPAGREADLDGYLNGGIAFDPRNNWSGALTGTNGIRVETISTEAASGVEVDPEATGAAGGKEAIATNFIDITVTPVADAPAVNVVNAFGDEDSPIRLSIQVNLTDTDGSENYSVAISGVPALGALVDAAGAPIPGVTNSGGGVWTITAGSPNAMAGILAQLHFLPPPNTGGETATGATDYNFGVAVTVTDTTAAGSNATTVNTSIAVSIVGDADPVNVAPVIVNATEDQRIAIGTAIRAALGTDAAILNDDDGSESLSFVVTLPPGVQPVDGSGNLIGSFIGSGWSIPSAQLADLHIPAPPNFSGSYAAFFAGFKVAVVNQEADGDQRVTSLPVAISIAPVSNGAGDGITGWSPAVTVTEGSDVPLANIVSAIQLGDGVTIASNTPEVIESVSVDFTNLLNSTGLIPGITSFAQLFTATYITGIGAPGLTIDTVTGVVTGTPAQIAALSIRAAALTDSNIDFALGVSAVTRDPGASTTSSASATFNVNMVGDADTPTSTAPATLAGTAGTPITLPIGNSAGNFGGATTDTDAGQGRPDSESIYYIVTGMPTGGAKMGFVDSGGNLVGSNLGDGSWYLTPADLATAGGLFLASTPSVSASTTILNWRTVAVENDGDLAFADAPTSITVNLAPTAGGSGGTPPNPPTVVISPPTAQEDGLIDLGVTATGAPGDSIVVVLTSLPPGVTITGAIQDGYGNYILPVVGGAISPAVQIRAAADFAGQLTFPMRVVATNSSLLEAEVSNSSVVTVEAIPDGPVASLAVSTGPEGVAVALGLAVNPRDNDGPSPETVDFAGAGVTVTVPAGSVLTGGTDLGGGVYRFNSAAALAAATLIPPEDYHGPITIQVASRTIDIDADGAGGPLTAPSSGIVTQNLTITIAARADAPLVTVGGPYSGTEDMPIALPGVTALLDDNDTSNGGEVLSVVIEGVPEGTRITGASNNGDGTWTVNGSTPAAIAASLATLSVTPPPNFSGELRLTVAAFAIESSNGDTAVTRTPLTVTVAPRADSFVIDALNTVANGATLLNIDLRGNDLTGTSPFENPPETVRLDFSNLPPGSILSGPEGVFTDLGGNVWRYEGRPEGAELITIEPGTTGTYTVNISGVSIDGAHTLPIPVVDSFVLNATVNSTAVNLTGTAANERLSGSTADDTISGVGGADVISGGAGIDLLSGGDGDDILSGGAGGDTLNGGNDNDQLYGGAGADTLNGGANADLIQGGAGIDLLTGGTGADLFRYAAGDVAALSPTGDTITDFSVAGGDRIDLSALLPGYDGSVTDLAQYVSLVEAGGNTTIRIASSTAGVIDTSVAVLQGVTGLDLAVLKQNGVLIA